MTGWTVSIIIQKTIHIQNRKQSIHWVASKEEEEEQAPSFCHCRSINIARNSEISQYNPKSRGQLSSLFHTTDRTKFPDTNPNMMSTPTKLRA